MNRKESPYAVSLEGKDRFQRLLPGEPSTRGMKSGAVVLKPGGSVGEHSTGAREEAIILLEGRGKLVFNDGEVHATEGMLVYVPPETVHDFTNTGKGPLKYVYVVAPVRG